MRDKTNYIGGLGNIHLNHWKNIKMISRGQKLSTNFPDSNIFNEFKDDNEAVSKL